MEFIKLIKRMPYIHCARGPLRCEKCKEFENRSESFALIKVYLKQGDIARPMTEVYVGCQRIFGEYDVLKRFEDDNEAKHYAIKNGIEIIFS